MTFTVWHTDQKTIRVCLLLDHTKLRSLYIVRLLVNGSYYREFAYTKIHKGAK